MNNQYWGVYKNLEYDFLKLMNFIHIDDKQLFVYSSKIVELILRSAIEIESITKDLYSLNGGIKIDYLKYDEDCLKHLNKKWNLEYKIVNISCLNCFQTIRTLQPFLKNELRSKGKGNTYSWNNAYQNIKHNRVEALKSFGNIKYLFEIMSALFMLNIYYKNDIFELNKDDKGTNFPLNLGSELFSIKLHRWKGSEERLYLKNDDFQESIYFIKGTNVSHQKQQQISKDFEIERIEILKNNNNIIQYFKNNPLNDEPLDFIKLRDIVGHNNMQNILSISYLKALKKHNIKPENFLNIIEYEAILNKRPK